MKTKPRIIELKRYIESDGEITIGEINSEIPFEIRRFFYIFNVPQGGTRANHASDNTEFVFVIVRGSAQANLFDGISKIRFTLDAGKRCLYVPKNTWMVFENFSSDAILLVLASKTYSESNYIDSYESFCLKTRDE